MKAAVITFPGINREKDIIDALRNQGDCVTQVFHKDSTLPDVDVIFLPGGFSYGDYLRAGAMAAKSPIMSDVIKAASDGKIIIGICNGFQILCESGLLEGQLARNKNLQFICDHVHLRIENNETHFTKAYDKNAVIKVPIAHMDGNYYADKDLLKKLEDNNQITFRYCNQDGKVNDDTNPNGSQNNIAGISNKQGNVFGLMPHPENAIFPHQLSSDGAGLFASLQERL